MSRLGQRSPKWRQANAQSAASCLRYSDGKSDAYKANNPRAWRARLVSMGYEILRCVRPANRRNSMAVYACLKDGQEVWKYVGYMTSGAWAVADVPRLDLLRLRGAFARVCAENARNR